LRPQPAACAASASAPVLTPAWWEAHSRPLERLVLPQGLGLAPELPRAARRRAPGARPQAVSRCCRSAPTPAARRQTAAGTKLTAKPCGVALIQIGNASENPEPVFTPCERAGARSGELRTEHGSTSCLGRSGGVRTSGDRGSRKPREAALGQRARRQSSERSSSRQTPWQV